MPPPLVKFKALAPADSIEAADLDKNFKLVSLSDKQGEDAPYVVQHGESGTEIIPNQTAVVFLSDGSAFLAKIVASRVSQVLSAPGSGKFVLACVNGTLTWMATDTC